FTNNGKTDNGMPTQSWELVYCSMLGLKASLNIKAPANSPNFALGPDATGLLKCRAAGTNSGFESGWHFGCQLVFVAAGKGMATTITFKSTDSKSGTTIYKPPPPTAGAVGLDRRPLKADDFQIRYADSILVGVGGVTGFDSASCVNVDPTHKDLNGQDTF